jgi:hypothetical protein
VSLLSDRHPLPPASPSPAASDPSRSFDRRLAGEFVRRAVVVIVAFEALRDALQYAQRSGRLAFRKEIDLEFEMVAALKAAVVVPCRISTQDVRRTASSARISARSGNGYSSMARCGSQTLNAIQTATPTNCSTMNCVVPTNQPIQ